MTDIEILNELIAPSAKIPLSAQHGKFHVDLKEPQCLDSEVTIRDLPSEAIVIKADSFKSPDSVFAGARGECKRADYVIIAEKDGRIFVIYIEMKKTKGQLNHIVQQLAGTQCFVRYCREIGKAFWMQSGFLDSAQHRFVSIGHTSIPKSKTRIDRPTGGHHRPDQMLKIHWPHYVFFNMLAS